MEEINHLRKEKLEEIGAKVDKLVPKKRMGKKRQRRTGSKACGETDDQFGRKHDQQFINCNESRLDKFLNKQRYLRRMAEKNNTTVDADDEVWEPHKFISTPRRMSFSFFSNMNLIVRGGVYHHKTG